MNETIVCTLLEGRYHLGLAALVNSIYSGGFRGNVCVGHKGAPPPWASPRTVQGRWETFSPIVGLFIHFLNLNVDCHLTNYKPQFMSGLIHDFATSGLRRVMYFDPDIVSLAPWTFFDSWADEGVALCEDVNSPLPDDHPIRHRWRRELDACGRPAVRRLDAYFNGGFLGLSRDSFGFLDDWHRIQSHIAPLCGQHLTGGPHIGTLPRRPHPFVYLDQDALNLTAMATDCVLSTASKDGMYFTSGNCLMAHATSQPKPWDTHFLLRTLARGGRPPTAHRLYFDHLEGPVRAVSERWVAWKKLDIKLAALAARVWS